jgi:25S rRNA (cytosine2278-C5)-methyltransferase
VSHILLDPSCSGSGLNRIEDRRSSTPDQSRLRKLSAFQRRLLLHAMSFPSVNKIVYSTCSHHPEENEQVVKAILKEMTNWRVLTRAQQPEGLRDWHRRGIREECDSDEISEGCIRCEKGTDGTIGFFAVGFVRENGDLHEEPMEENRLDDEDNEEEWHGLS